MALRPTRQPAAATPVAADSAPGSPPPASCGARSAGSSRSSATLEGLAYVPRGAFSLPQRRRRSADDAGAAELAAPRRGSFEQLQRSRGGARASAKGGTASAALALQQQEGGMVVRHTLGAVRAAAAITARMLWEERARGRKQASK